MGGICSPFFWFEFTDYIRAIAMREYLAVISFDDDRLGSVKRDQKLTLSDAAAARYKQAGLIREKKNSDGDDPVASATPMQAAGEPLSALPVAQASPPAIAAPLKRGRKRKKAEASSL